MRRCSATPSARILEAVPVPSAAVAVAGAARAERRGPRVHRGAHRCASVCLLRRAFVRAACDRNSRSGVFAVRHPDPSYAARREDVLLVAVNCSDPSGTCFCTSMRIGPKASSGYDLALTEVLNGGGHRFVVEVGSDQGALMLADVPCRSADDADERDAAAVTAGAVTRMGRQMPEVDLRELLYANYEHPRWDDVAERCLTCGNCTMVCPTCFCTSVEDTADLAGEEAERSRRWESCFSLSFSHVSGGEARNSPRSRYRQWMTHNLRPGLISSAHPDVWAADVASPGVRSASTSPRRSPRFSRPGPPKRPHREPAWRASSTNWQRLGCSGI